MNEVSAIIGVRGFGLPCARRLGLGRTLLLGDVSVAILEESAAALRADGYEVAVREVDVSDRASVEAFAAASKELGRLHSFVVTAGLSPRAASAERILSVNMLGTEYVKSAFEPLLTKGSIGIVFASNAAYYNPVSAEVERAFALSPIDELVTAAKTVQGWETGLGAYWLAKRCNQLRVQASAAAWGKRGARIVSVSPGIFSTAMIHEERAMGSPVEETVAAMPVGRIGKPDEIAALVEWLASPAGAFITGTDILIDGGMIGALRWSQMQTEDPQDAAKQTPAKD